MISEKRVIAGYNSSTAKRIIHAYVVENQSLLNRKFVRHNETSLCSKNSRKRTTNHNLIAFLSPQDDYGSVPHDDGTFTYPTKGVDFLDVVESENCQTCDRCTIIVRQQQHSGYDWDYVLLMRKKRVPFSEWFNYVGYPAEWLTVT